jgi:serine/threonine protein kinase
MLVMEYCCFSLFDILEYYPELNFNEYQIASVCASIIKGLAYLHGKGISHRDIKPGNILLTENGQAKIADFGISVQLKNINSKMSSLAGSPYWCAPEVITENSYDKKVDIWSLGIVAIEMAEKKPPYWQMDPFEVIRHIPKQPSPTLKDLKKWSKDFINFLDQCLKKNPKERSNAKNLLMHPFILSGSSSQILQPLIQESSSIIIQRKRFKEKKKIQNQNIEFLQKGTLFSVDKYTNKVEIIYPTVYKMQSFLLNINTSKKYNANAKYFGASLEKIMNTQPNILDIIIEYLSKMAIDVEGLFQKPGNQEKINELKNLFEKKSIINLDRYSPIDISSLFQLFLFELPEPILSKNLYSKMLMEIKEIDINKNNKIENKVP